MGNSSTEKFRYYVPEYSVHYIAQKKWLTAGSSFIQPPLGNAILVSWVQLRQLHMKELYNQMPDFMLNAKVVRVFLNHISIGKPIC